MKNERNLRQINLSTRLGALKPYNYIYFSLHSMPNEDPTKSSVNDSSLETSAIISVIIPTYERPGILSKCLESLAIQTSKRFETIVVCNGSTDKTFEVVDSFRELLPSLQTIIFSENIWSWTDHSIYYSTVYRKGMLNANGDFLLFLSDDDAISPEFIERAIHSLTMYADCVAFMGYPIDRDLSTGIDIEADYAIHGLNRPRLEDGRSLALRYFSPNPQDNLDLADPGFGYVIKSTLYKDPELQDLIWSGGYEIPQYLALIPNGMVAFDPDAKFYWGRHVDQANRQLNARIGTLHSYEAVWHRERQLAIPIWRERFGREWANALESRLASKTGFRAVRFLWKTHPYDRNVVWVLGRIIRDPRKLSDVARTDGREPLFWILMPRACTVIFQRLLKRLRTLLDVGFDRVFCRSDSH